MDETVFESSKRMMSSASFGQIIILIVYLPLLSLIGIEGKMFRPMAQTVFRHTWRIHSFTHLHSYGLCFAVKQKTSHSKNISDRMMDFFERIYSPLLEKIHSLETNGCSSNHFVFAVSVSSFQN